VSDSAQTDGDRLELLVARRRRRPAARASGLRFRPATPAMAVVVRFHCHGQATLRDGALRGARYGAGADMGAQLGEGGSARTASSVARARDGKLEHFLDAAGRALHHRDSVAGRWPRRSNG